MRARRTAVSATAMALPLVLAGCNVLPTTRHLPVPTAPPMVQTATPHELVQQINQRWDALNSLTATAEIYATETKPAQGTAKDWPSVRGYIILSKPRNLRVYGTYFNVNIFDMASDGDRFTLLIPPKSTAIKGTNTSTEKSANTWENLRPNFFFDAIAVRGLEPDEEYMVSADTDTIEDAAKKHLYLEPEYVLSVMRRKPDSQELMPVRVITFHRDDLQPYAQDLYDAEGNLETQITYSNYQNFAAGPYPSRVVIKRPIEGIQLTLQVERVQKNVQLPADEFIVKIPPGTNIRELK
jgi:outer membrane lipoprotein-sorting protein